MGDVTEIKTAIGALAVHVDARDWEALIALFATRVRVDYTSLFGGEAQTTDREQLIAQWRALLPGFTQTTHLVGTPLVAVTGKAATAQAPVVAWHFLRRPDLAGNDLWLVGGRYEVELRKTERAWRICALTLANAWQQGNPDLPAMAAKSVQAIDP